jgi:hypothetical protein
LYKGAPTGSKVDKYSGKIMLGLAGLSTVLGIANTVHLNKRPSKVTESDVMKNHKESVVS